MEARTTIHPGMIRSRPAGKKTTTQVARANQLTNRAPTTSAPYARRQEVEEERGGVVQSHLLEVKRQAEQNATSKFCSGYVQQNNKKNEEKSAGHEKHNISDNHRSLSSADQG